MNIVLYLYFTLNFIFLFFCRSKEALNNNKKNHLSLILLKKNEK